MKKITIIFLALVLSFCTISVAHADTGVNSLPFTASPQTVIDQIGSPIQQSARDGLSIYWYGSADPLSADFVYFRSDQLVMKSVTVQSSDQTLDQYTRKYNAPDFSVKKFSKESEDSLDSVMHVWLANGVMLQTNGRAKISPVSRIFSFIPTDKEHFYAVLAPDLAGNEEISVTELPVVASAVPISQRSNELLAQAQQLYYTQTPFLVVGVVLFIFLFLLIAYRGR